MKFKLFASAFSNCTYNREEEFEDDMMTKEDWDSMSQHDQDEYLKEIVEEFIWDDIDAGAEPIE